MSFPLRAEFDFTDAVKYGRITWKVNRYSQQVNIMSVASSYPHVVSNPDLFQGEPYVQGLRIRVRDIVLARDQGGFIPEEIAATVYPDLSLAQVYSALAYYEDHRTKIDKAIADERAAVDSFRQNHPDLAQDRTA